LCDGSSRMVCRFRHGGFPDSPTVRQRTGHSYPLGMHLRTRARTIQISATSVIISLGLAAFGSSGAAASPRAGAAGNGLKCAKTARIVSSHGAGKITVYGQRHPSGDTFGKKVLHRHNAYELSGKRITLEFGTNHYQLSDGSIFMLNCSGESVSEPAIMPSLIVLRGKIRVHTTKSRNGSVYTEEALFGPLAGSNKPMKLWFANVVDQPQGTSRGVTTTSSKLNVTPYVGPKQGTCRAVQSAKLVSRSFNHGTAKYNF
jgi:hypothetical protein